MNLDKVEAISFIKSISANSSEVITERVKAKGTVEKIRVKFYPGPEGALHLTPYIMHKGERKESLLTYPEGTNQFISGEDEEIILNVNTKVDNDDVIWLEVENIAVANAYTLNCQIEIDYFAGQKRVVGGVIGG